ncbi:SAM pointed domain-containing Ets transcription factor [Anoplophora glabripennis]|uniref:SAM pointed domain-containing Ets transcription factor n=1 Tax=Anoplophora glabripennis TaxID=217634 RepID=UPI0008741E5F|nr:SAM pointed domain-containing Ets transcription factor [Anoplophora glabripennis]
MVHSYLFFQGIRDFSKIGHYDRTVLMALQAAETPVRYGLSEWERLVIYKTPQSFEDDDLPKDPRQWTRDDVAQWLRHVTSLHKLPEVPPSRFLMNGKALCLMSPSMFLSRVPLGGKLLYKDFQLRLCAAMYSRT